MHTCLETGTLFRIISSSKGNVYSGVKPAIVLLVVGVVIASALALRTTAVYAAEAGPRFRSENIFEKNETGHAQNHASSIAELPNGDLMASWFGGTREGMPDVGIWISRRPAGETDWTVPEKIIDEPGYAAGNSIVFADSAGTTWLFYLIKYADHWAAWDKCRVYAIKSNDSGRTWSDPMTIEDELGWVIRNNPVEIEPGKILLPVYTEDPANSWMWISEDGFRTKKKTQVPYVEPGHYQPAVAPMGEKKLIMLARHHTLPGRIWVSLSKNNGESWYKPKLTALPNPDSGISLIALDSGALLLAYNNSKWVRTPLTVAISDDGGRSWPVKKNLESSSSEFSYPYLIQDSDGTIHITYTSENREYIRHAEFNEAWLRGE